MSIRNQEDVLRDLAELVKLGQEIGGYEGAEVIRLADSLGSGLGVRTPSTQHERQAVFPWKPTARTA